MGFEISIDGMASGIKFQIANLKVTLYKNGFGRHEKTFFGDLGVR